MYPLLLLSCALKSYTVGGVVNVLIRADLLPFMNLYTDNPRSYYCKSALISALALAYEFLSVYLAVHFPCTARESMKEAIKMIQVSVKSDKNKKKLEGHAFMGVVSCEGLYNGIICGKMGEIEKAGMLACLMENAVDNPALFSALVRALFDKYVDKYGKTVMMAEGLDIIESFLDTLGLTEPAWSDCKDARESKDEHTN